MAVNIDTMTPPLLPLLCPRCGEPLAFEHGTLRCHRDESTIISRGGIWDLLDEEKRREHEAFLGIYRDIRRAEGRGSRDASYYLALPFGEEEGERGREWELRAESMMWLQELFAAEHLGPALRVLDAGAGNCWLTRHLAAWGAIVVALDINDDDEDGLGAGSHYLRSLPIDFDRVIADFGNLPFRDGEFDLVLFNGAFHYAEDQPTIIAEALRVLRRGGRIVLIDSPVYHDRASGWKMLAERSRQSRAGFLTFDGLAALAERFGLICEIHPPQRSLASRAKKRLAEIRIGREIATMARVVMRRA